MVNDSPDPTRPPDIVGRLGKATAMLVAITTFLTAAGALAITVSKGSDQILPVFRQWLGGPPKTASPDITAGPCAGGYVLREAGPNDMACVTPVTRERTAEENRRAPTRWDPSAGYGPYGCQVGYVWREAFPGDVVCVVPDVRDLVGEDNRLAASRRAASPADAR